LVSAFLNAAGFKDHAEAQMNWYRVTDPVLYGSGRLLDRDDCCRNQADCGAGGDTKPLAYFDKVFAPTRWRGQTNRSRWLPRPLPGVAMPANRGSPANASDGSKSVSGALDRLVSDWNHDQSHR